MRTLQSVKFDLELERKILRKRKKYCAEKFPRNYRMNEEYFIFLKGIDTIKERIKNLEDEYKQVKQDTAVLKEPPGWDSYSLG